MRRCPYCGEKLYQDDDYCLFCGRFINKKHHTHYSQFNPQAFEPKVNFMMDEDDILKKRNLKKRRPTEFKITSLFFKFVIFIWIVLFVCICIRMINTFL